MEESHSSDPEELCVAVCCTILVERIAAVLRSITGESCRGAPDELPVPECAALLRSLREACTVREGRFAVCNNQGRHERRSVSTEL